MSEEQPHIAYAFQDWFMEQADERGFVDVDDVVSIILNCLARIRIHFTYSELNLLLAAVLDHLEESIDTGEAVLRDEDGTMPLPTKEAWEDPETGPILRALMEGVPEGLPATWFDDDELEGDDDDQ